MPIALLEMDLDGNARIFEGVVDLGAFKFTTNIEPISTPTPTSTPTSKPTPSPIPNETDDGNKMKDATMIYVDEERTAAIDYEGDCDWFKFTTTAKGTYIIQSFGNEVDTWGELTNNKGKMISSNDDGGTNSNFKIVEKLDAGKIYYIYVDGTKVGRYSIKVELSSK